MHPNAVLLATFYQAFKQKDYPTMIGCYHPNAVFNDAVFNLQGKQIGAMWHMFCESGDLAIDFRGIAADEQTGQALWEAEYTFSFTGRKVHNSIRTHITFADGKIMRHHDRFDFWRWSRQAFGMGGVLLGWTPLLRKRVQRAAATKLQQFIAAHPQYQP